ncbi:MAG: hypothetical protein KF778_17925 [Rhodocyclaceae bacterium]|nr:hypothetical protein [Rhodocyclaceae bacterium]
MPKHTLVVAVSRVRFAGLKPALDAAMTKQNMRPIFCRRRISADFDRR